MNCRQARTRFSTRVDGELDVQESGALQQHLVACPECAARWASFEATVRMVRSLPKVEPDPSFVGQVLDRVRAYEAGCHVPEPMSTRWDLSARLREVLETGLVARFLYPARLAGAVAFGLLAGFVLVHQGWMPLWSASGPMVALSSTADPSARFSGGQRSAALPGDVSRERPFADLAADLSNSSTGSGADTTDQVPAEGQQLLPPQFMEPQGGPGQQVMLGAASGRPQITF
jgi:anti-sigma factor RsiW